MWTKDIKLVHLRKIKRGIEALRKGDTDTSQQLTIESTLRPSESIDDALCTEVHGFIDRARSHSRMHGRMIPPRLLGTAGVIESIDCHCAGLAARVVVDGAPAIPEEHRASADAIRLYLMGHQDWFRAVMLTEPRGYPCQNLDVVFAPTTNCPEALFSYVIAENHPCYPAMSGHNTICVATALLETGRVPMQEPTTSFLLEAPAGPIQITAQCAAGKAVSITFRNAPAFARPQDLGLSVTVPKGELGTVSVDVAYGGMWYVIVEAAALGSRVHLEEADQLVRHGEMLKAATAQQHPMQHPTVQDPGWNTCIRGEAQVGGSAANAVVMSTGHLDWERPGTWTGNLDRSPCGTGACTAALHGCA